MSKLQKTTERKSASKTSTDALEIIDRNIIGDDLELRELVEQATFNARVASIVYDARKAARLTQKELATMIETDQAVISRLEDSDYEGHSLSILNRIAKALGAHVEIKFVPDEAA